MEKCAAGPLRRRLGTRKSRCRPAASRAAQGGFVGKLAERAMVTICCANHCRRQNIPTGGTVGRAPWQILHHAAWWLAVHSTSPSQRPATTRSAAPLAGRRVYSSRRHHRWVHSQGTPLECSSIVLTGAPQKCIQQVVRGGPLWSNRKYSFITAPNDVLGRAWSYRGRIWTARARAKRRRLRGHGAEERGGGHLLRQPLQ